MNKEQTNQFRMFLTTQSYLDANVTLWSGIPRVVSYKNMLDEIIARIQAKNESTQQGVGVTQQKEQLREAIGIKASMLSGVLQVIATEQNNTDLAIAVKMTQSDIARFRESELGAAVKNIISKANENLETLAEFGITQDVITELSTSVDDFNVLIGQPRTILSQKYAALKNIEELFDEGNSLLKLQIDNSMLLFRISQTEFYKGYQNARTIIDN
jgi:hypothetical protein